MTLPAFNTLAEAYTAGLDSLLRSGRMVPSVTDPASVASNFGEGDRPSIELLGHGFELREPLAALIDSPVWQPRLDYYFGLLAWSLSGDDDVMSLAYYHPAATRFSDDGAHLSGAFGHRLLRHASRSQLDILIERLRADPASRRAIAPIVEPGDNFRHSREFPCAASVQYFIRDGRLDCVVHMRAQQALFVLPYDVFLFIGFQAVLAAELEVDVGTYRHFAGTFHIYRDERELAEEILGSRVDPLRLEPPDEPFRAQVASLERWETALRSAATSGDGEELRRLTHAVEAVPAGTLSGQAARVFLLKAAAVSGEDEVMGRAPAMLDGVASLVAAFLGRDSRPASTRLP
jgi:thymidylate synthase